MTVTEAAKRIVGKRTRWCLRPVAGATETFAVEGAGHELLGYISADVEGTWWWSHPRHTNDEWRKL